jgi:PAS domain S-box-containing protein
METETTRPARKALAKQDSLQAIRDRVLNTVIGILVIVALPGLLASLSRTLEIGWQNIMYVHLTSYLIVLLAAIFRKRLTYGVRAGVLFLLIFLTGAASIISWGLIGNFIFMLILVMLATVLYGIRAGVISLGIVILFNSAVALAVQVDVLSFEGVDYVEYATAVSTWISRIVSFGFFGAMMVVAAGLLYRYLAEYVEELQASNRALTGEITERARAEEALRESEERFRSVYENAVVGFYRTTPDGRILMANPALVRMLGYSTFEELAQRNLEESGFTQEHPRAAFKQLMEEDGQVVGLESIWLRRDDTSIFVRESAVAIRDEPGNTAYYEGTVEDITEQVWAREALSLLDQARGALARELDLPDVIDTVVESIADAFGYTLVSLYLLEGDVLMLQHQVGYDNVISQIPATEGISGRVIRTEKPVLLKDVTADPDFLEAVEGIVSEVCVPLFAGGKIAGTLNVESQKGHILSEADLQLMIALSEHVNVAIERARLYTDAKERAARLELIARTGQQTTAILQIDELLHRAVNLIGEAFGYHSTQVLLVEGEDLVLTASTDPALQPLEGELRLRIGAEGITGWVAGNGEALLVPDVEKEPRYHHVEAEIGTQSELAVPIKLKGIVIGVLDVQSTEIDAFSEADVHTLQTIADQLAITIENAQLYEELAARRDFLEKAVGERTRELTAANEQLQALSRVKDEFVSDVSHELRTPITTLMLHHSLLERNPAGLDRSLPVLHRETERLHNIIENLLRLSRLDQDQVSLDPAPIDLNVLASQYFSDRLLLAEGRGLRMTFAGQGDLPAVLADEGLLGQVMGILLTNALNYTPGGGSVEVSTQLVEEDGQPWVTFSVSDTGPGIPPDEVPRLFERFFRGQAGRESGEPGTGLGLAIAKEIVERHQGRIEVGGEGKPDKGATLTVWLPVEGGRHA